MGVLYIILIHNMSILYYTSILFNKTSAGRAEATKEKPGTLRAKAVRIRGSLGSC